MTDEPHQDELIAAAIQGDRLALSQLLYLYHASLMRYLNQQSKLLGQSAEGVEDIVQETFLLAFRNIHQCSARDEGQFRAWLRTIGRHQMLNAHQAARAIKRGGRFSRVAPQGSSRSSSLGSLAAQLADDDERPSQAAARRQAAAAVQIGLAQLPDDQRQAIEMRYLHGHTEHSVAINMGRSRDAVHGLIARARSSMRELLGRSSRWFYRK